MNFNLQELKAALHVKLLLKSSLHEVVFLAFDAVSENKDRDRQLKILTVLNETLVQMDIEETLKARTEDYFKWAIGYEKDPAAFKKDFDRYISSFMGVDVF